MRELPQLSDGSYGYHPSLESARDLVRSCAFGEVLVLGTGVPDISEFVSSVRGMVSVPHQMKSGIYWFHDHDCRRMMLATDRTHPGQPQSVLPDEVEPDHALVNARGWYDVWWDDATVLQPPRFAVDDQVITLPTHQDATVRKRVFRAGSWVYDIRVDGRIRSAIERSLEPQPVDEDAWLWIEGPAEPAEGFAATLTRAKLSGNLTDTVYSFRATKTTFRPYQFKPVLKLLQTGSHRLLIADEVGLGKTIEAGLLWTELEARGLANRVLILAPSSLVAKWKREMDERFGFELRELDSSGLADLAERLINDRVPTRGAYICSIERMRIWDALKTATELRLRFDLVIVDEAHAFRNEGTRSNTLGELVSTWADALVFLSATPLNLRTGDLYNLLELLAPGEFETPMLLEQRLEPNAVLNKISASFFTPGVDNVKRRSWLEQITDLTFADSVTNRHEYAALVEMLAAPELTPGETARAKRLITELNALSATVTRTRKVEIQEHKPVREPWPITVAWTPQEQAFYDLFYAWCEDRARQSDTPVGFSMQMPLRLVSTCLPVAKNQVLSWTAKQVWPTDEDAPAGEVPLTVSADLPPPSELIEAARALGDLDTKLSQFLPVVQNLIRQQKRALVFTFSRPTLAYLEQKLARVARVAVMHGGVPKKARARIMAEFRDGTYDLLLANRVASEGLDFEFCSAVVNYDLPWNPMEVEQRIGRIDRIGQVEKKIQVVHFHTPGTIETDIIERVMQRIGVFERSIGELEPIIQRGLEGLRKTMFDFTLDQQQRDRRSQEMLTALEAIDLARDDLETAAASLLSSDGMDVEGFERDLVARGGYVGQPELALLIKDWVRLFPDARLQLQPDGRELVLRGTPAMAQQVSGLADSGERSVQEIDLLVRDLQNETEMHFSLDQQWSQIGGGPALLTANHPLVRTALAVPGHRQVRHSSVTLRSDPDALPVGRYLVQLGVAHWRGVRSTKEIWSAVADLDTRAPGPAVIGDAVLARLADAALADAESVDRDELAAALSITEEALQARQVTEQGLRGQDNEALLATRRISITEVHAHRRSNILRKIHTLRERGKLSMLPAFEAQLRSEDHREQEAVEALIKAGFSDLYVEPLAVVTVRVPA
jgi:superfamily II DNA or RNA helicase